jgi:hypothetical protein
VQETGGLGRTHLDSIRCNALDRAEHGHCLDRLCRYWKVRGLEPSALHLPSASNRRKDQESLGTRKYGEHSSVRLVQGADFAAAACGCAAVAIALTGYVQRGILTSFCRQVS